MTACGAARGDGGFRCAGRNGSLGRRAALAGRWLHGRERPDARAVQLEPLQNRRLHRCGKHQSRSGRKMGYVTAVGSRLGDALSRAPRVASALLV
ncbi:MAG: hypothetical protein HYX52_02720 [Chloroflexi bacterium]|nr:hypothetical protein [Chloroflexota bacterium]